MHTTGGQRGPPVRVSSEEWDLLESGVDRAPGTAHTVFPIW
jgi:hypothetical protein